MIGAYQFLKKYGVAIGFGLGAVLAILTFAIILGGYPDGNPNIEELNKNHSDLFNFGLYAAYFLLIVAIAVTIIAPVIYMAMNPKDSVKILIGVGVMIVLYFITNAMGDGTVTVEMFKSDDSLLTAEQVANFKVGETQTSAVKFADGLILFGYVMMIVAFVLVLAAAIRDFIKGQ
ncbi:MAG: hypothetical protein GY810_05255 [Aureispira sp.]|nr:hypothetical protein [Aureispira sp.]